MTSKEIKRKQSENSDNDLAKDNFLILHNDDVHSFEYVTHALIEICEHTFEQASQCTLITHYKGKCDIKKGCFSILKSFKDKLIDKGLDATID